MFKTYIDILLVVYFVDPFCNLCFMLVFIKLSCHILGRADLFAFLCVVFSCVLIGFLGQVLYLIVSIPDLCISLNFILSL